MKTYLLKINIEKTVKADDESEVLANLENELADENDTLLNYFIDNSKIEEVCPHCETPLENKMIDGDGTNLEERQVCEKCGYGYPSLK